jgi:hypothetical protein
MISKWFLQKTPLNPSKKTALMLSDFPDGVHRKSGATDATFLAFFSR